MKENKLPYLLPIRSIMFLFVFLAGSLITRKGLKAVRLDALACNTPAHRLYESLGFQKRDVRHWYAEKMPRSIWSKYADNWQDFQKTEIYKKVVA